MKLSAEQIRQFDEQGYLLLPELLLARKRSR